MGAQIVDQPKFRAVPRWGAVRAELSVIAGFLGIEVPPRRANRSSNGMPITVIPLNSFRHRGGNARRGLVLGKHQDQLFATGPP